jgi:hypothetical protein
MQKNAQASTDLGVFDNHQLAAINTANNND